MTNARRPQSRDLDEEVRDLLAARQESWEELEQRSGVSASWMSKFFNGHIPNPGVATLKKIRDACRGDARRNLARAQ